MYSKNRKLTKSQIEKIQIQTKKIVGEKTSTKIIDGFWRYSILIVFFLIVIGPLLEIVVIAFSEEQNTINTEFIFTWKNFKELYYTFIKDQPMPIYNYFINSVIVSTLATFWKVWLCMFAGFALYYYNTKLATIGYALLLGTMTIPTESLIVGQFSLFFSLGLENTLLALIMPYTVSVFTIFMFKNAFNQIPKSIFYSAKVDGSSAFKAFFKIGVPMVAPEIWKASIMGFISSWNSVIWPSTIILSNTHNSATLPLFLRRLSMIDKADPDFQHYNVAGIKMAGTIIVLTPMFIFYLLTKNLIIKSITKQSGVKG